MSNDIIYLDHAAATPVDTRVVATMLPYFTENFYNPSSPYVPAVNVRREYDAAKARLAATFGAKADEIVITAGATESINLAFAAVSGHVVTSAIEHPAVLEAAKQQKHTLVSPTAHGMIEVSAIEAAITDETQMISVQFANNEIGTVQPIRAIADVVSTIRKRRAEKGKSTPLYFHCDASQGFGHVDIHIGRLGVDLLTLNSGKMYGPKQVGLLWAASHVVLRSIIMGGGQEHGLRSGTENVAGVIGFAAAAELATRNRKSENTRLVALRDELAAGLTAAFPDAVISGHPKKHLPNILHISFPGLDAERLVFVLEAKNILLATGSACAANKGTGSHVLKAIGMDASLANGSLRISLGRLSQDDSLRTAAKVIQAEIEREYARVGKNA